MGAITLCLSVNREVYILPAKWEKGKAEERAINGRGIIADQVTCQERPARICRICTGRAYECNGMLELREIKNKKWVRVGRKPEVDLGIDFH